MKVKKAVITAASRSQRALPLQTLVDRDGGEKTVLAILLEQVLAAGIEDVCVVTAPGDEDRFAQAAGQQAGRVRFVPQPQPLGYGHAIYCAREFTAADPFLHLVGDHLYVSRGSKSCAQRLVELAEAESCAISAVQATREALLGMFGAVGGPRVAGAHGVYRIEIVMEKPTPTEAEQRLIVPGLRAGHYLCFFGMHVLTPTVMELLGLALLGEPSEPVTLSAALAELARREQYLAVEDPDRRYDIGARYGLLTAQLALALSGRERNEVLSNLLELLADRELTRAAEDAR